MYTLQKKGYESKIEVIFVTDDINKPCIRVKLESIGIPKDKIDKLINEKRCTIQTFQYINRYCYDTYEFIEVDML